MSLKPQFFFLIVHLLPSAFAVTSTTGTIRFDTNDDGSMEMVLNATGLGIGAVPSANLSVQENTLIDGLLALGTASMHSNLNLGGTIGFSSQNLSTNATLDLHSHVLVDTSSGPVTLNLPYADNVSGRSYFIKKKSSLNTLTVKAQSGLIDTSEYYHLTAGNTDFINVMSNSAQ